MKWPIVFRDGSSEAYAWQIQAGDKIDIAPLVGPNRPPEFREVRTVAAEKRGPDRTPYVKVFFSAMTLVLTLDPFLPVRRKKAQIRRTDGNAEGK